MVHSIHFFNPMLLDTNSMVWNGGGGDDKKSIYSRIASSPQIFNFLTLVLLQVNFSLYMCVCIDVESGCWLFVCACDWRFKDNVQQYRINTVYHCLIIIIINNGKKPFVSLFALIQWEIFKAATSLSLDKEKK